MRQFLKFCPLYLFLVLLLPGCVSPQRDLAQFSIPGPAEEPAYREKAMEFVRYAQAGDVAKMLEITSALSFATKSDSVRTVYAQQVVPRFEGMMVTWDQHSTGVTDDRYNGGLKFTGTIHGKKTLSFDIIIMKENGKLVVINIMGHHWYSH